MYKLTLILIAFYLTQTFCEIKYNMDCSCKNESDNGLFCQEWECSEEEDTGSCFPSDSFAFNYNYTPIQMKDLVIGDKIISGTPQGKIIYDEIIGFLHFRPEVNMNYMVIETESNDKGISITEKHVIVVKGENEEGRFLAKDCGYEFPKNLVVGNQLMVVDQKNQQLSWEKIVRIQQVEKKGMYAPLTKSGTLIVDGILVSCYANFKHQKIADFMFQPYQFLYSYFPQSGLLKNNEKTGILEYADLLMRLSSIMPTELNYQKE